MMNSKFPLHPTKIEQIHLLNQLLKNIFPDYSTENPHEEWLVRSLSTDQLPYLPLVLELSSGLTCLYHRHRVKSSLNVYECCMEDILAALGMLQAQLSPLSLVGESAQYVYGRLSSEGAELMSRRAIMKLTGYSKTHIQRILHELYEMGLLKRTGSVHKYFYGISKS